MTAASIVRSAIAAGIRIKVDGDKLLLSASDRPDDHLVRSLRAAKWVVLDYLKGLALWDEEDWSALHDERAGIMEFDGGLSRGEAERQAREEVDVLRQLVAQIHA